MNDKFKPAWFILILSAVFHAVYVFAVFVILMVQKIFLYGNQESQQNYYPIPEIVNIAVSFAIHIIIILLIKHFIDNRRRDSLQAISLISLICYAILNPAYNIFFDFLRNFLITRMYTGEFVTRLMVLSIISYPAFLKGTAISLLIAATAIIWHMCYVSGKSDSVNYMINTDDIS